MPDLDRHEWRQGSSLIKNVKPFDTKGEAVQMAQESFAQLTGADRYFAEEDVWKDSKPE